MPAMSQTITQQKVIGLTIYDVIFVLVMLMLSVLIGASWLVEPSVESIPLIQQIGLSVLMSSLASLALVFYSLGLFTKRLSPLKIISPFLLIVALISIPIWLTYNMFIPLTSSILVSAGIQNYLIVFLGVDTFNWLTHVWMFAVIESIFLGIMLFFFTVFSKTTRGLPILIPVFLIINGFMALLHTGVAMALQPTGLDFGIVLTHQFVTFFILSGMFFLTGTAGAISSHQVKNQMALGLGAYYWFALFAIYAIFFIISSRQMKESPLKLARQRFGV